MEFLPPPILAQASNASPTAPRPVATQQNQPNALPLANPANAQAGQQNWLSQPYNPDILLPKLRMVESSGDPNSINPKENALGHLQIRPAVIVDVNQLLQQRGSQLRYTHQDAYDPKKAVEIFKLFHERYTTEKRLGRPPTNEDAARIWNGGPMGYKTSGLRPDKLQRLKKYVEKIKVSEDHNLEEQPKPQQQIKR
jgi:hypothetical protein